jgi:hypothetical protein
MLSTAAARIRSWLSEHHAVAVAPSEAELTDLALATNKLWQLDVNRLNVSSIIIIIIFIIVDLVFIIIIININITRPSWLTCPGHRQAVAARRQQAQREALMKLSSVSTSTLSSSS